MKNYLIISFIVFANLTYAQTIAIGRVVDAQSGDPISNIRISENKGKTHFLSDSKGEFTLEMKDFDFKVKFDGQGYESTEVLVSSKLQGTLVVKMNLKSTNVEEVTIMTGYQNIARERATGSFSTVDSDLFKKQVTTNIMDRLPSVANGLTVDQGSTGLPQLMVRGISSISGPKDPLIILDDFPFEGNLNSLNPDIVQSVTVLKDAAASSIWGARAANGVIVITTKKGKLNQPLRLEFTANTTFASSPDLNYLKGITSTDLIDVETELFNRGNYTSAINSPNHPVLSPVVDLLNQASKGLMSIQEAQVEIDKLRKIDVRDQFKRYMYSTAVNNQYALNLSSGTNKMSWMSALGYDSNTGNLSEEFQRLNFSLQNVWKPIKKLTISTSMSYANTKDKSGKIGYGGVNIEGNEQVPYLQFADDSGNPLIVVSRYDQRYKNSLVGSGLLDWNYYPLTDWMHSTSTGASTYFTINSSIKYEILKGLDAELRYNYQLTHRLSETLNDEESYYTRNYLNDFAYYDPQGILKWRVPKGSILYRSNTQSTVNNFRGQLNYHLNSERHNIDAIAGAEARTTNIDSNSFREYGYNTIKKTSMHVDYLNPYPRFVNGNPDYIVDSRSMQEMNTNYMSFYANAAYTFDKKYILSGSVRRDASNLFGLTTNNQWNPFWSAGAAWKISEEPFYRLAFIPNLKVRGSYGYSGNINPAMVAVTTIIYDTALSPYTQTGTARVDQYYNPGLKWETSRMINFALDFSTKNNRISGSFDYFVKKGSNLFGPAPLDYTTGISSMLMNIAGMKGQGLDIELHTVNLKTNFFKWNSTLNFSIYQDEVSNYHRTNPFASSYVHVSGNNVPIGGIVGKPVYSVFAYKWAGLDPITGDPQGYLNGEISKEYAAITGSEKGLDDLEYFGSALPTKYGSFLNSFGYRNFSLDVGITYKLGYWFRRNSINYTNLIRYRVGHSDYAARWQNPGDELVTNVPSFQYVTNVARDQFYNGSSALVEKGDHVRLQYLNFAYEFAKNEWRAIPFESMRVYAAVSNLGIIWRANDLELDPDYSFTANALKPVTTYSIGLNVKF
ncbi:SusC/RagA family TonB-linked outer membrane protein [Chryseobacterium sp. A301]